tara:strand:- start:2743 stop:3816 length:1074 start_codon:yes stop_codon:yes gene_type:complete
MYNVIGSGTAAWIACLYLLKADKQVTLYRDPDVVVRKIGESTVPTINEIPKLIDMDEQEFLHRVNGYFKYGTLFSGWKDNNSWMYSFANEPDNKITSRYQTYAYHIDAPGFCEVLQEWCEKQNNFKIIHSKFTLNQYTADEFYIDATGQHGVLSNQVELVHTKSDFLINDYAIIGNDNTNYKPYTQSQVMSNGWMWSISLQSRMSHGYVFSSKYQSIEDAIVEFETHTSISHENVIKFETRIPEQAWKENVLFLGLSAGFIEPLNATANFAAQSGIKNFLLLEDNPQAYNRLMNKTYNGIHKWIKALYSCNTCTGEYWDYYKTNHEQAIKDIYFYSEHGHQGLMGKHSWNLLKENML